MMRIITLLFLIHAHSCVLGFVPHEETREEMAIRILNNQIKKNAALIKIGAFEETRYIVDVRGKWWIDGVDDITQETLDVANAQLQEINLKSGLAFYTMLSAPFINASDVIIQHTDGSYAILKQGQFVTVAADAIDEEKERQRQEMDAIRKEFAINVALKSKIGDKASKGILFNLEANVSGYINDRDEKSIEYIPVVALGRRLSAFAVQETYKEITRNIDRTRYSFGKEFSKALGHYIGAIGVNAQRIYEKIDGVLADESALGNLEGKLIKYVGANSHLVYNLSNLDTKQNAREINEYLFTMVDHAHISKIDPKFSENIMSGLQDFQGDVSLGSITGVPLRLYIITTSDVMMPQQKTAIQLANEMAANLMGDYIVVALHFRLDDESVSKARVDEQGNSINEDIVVPVQLATVMSEDLKEKLLDARVEQRYNVYRHKETGQLVAFHGDLVGMGNVDRNNSTGYFITDNPYEYYADHADKNPITGELLAHNIGINFFPFALMNSWGIEGIGALKANEDVAAAWVLDIAFTAATAGGYAIGKTVIQAGLKVTKGALMDASMQVAIIMLFEGKSFDEALKNVDYGGAIYGGVEEFIGDWRAVAALACMRESMLKGVRSANEGKELMKEVSEACGLAVLKVVVFKALPKKLKPVIVKYARQNFPDFIAKLKILKPDLTNQDAIDALKAMDGVEEISPSVFKSTDLKYLTQVNWQGDVTFKGKSGKTFWEMGEGNLKHMLKDGFYLKHNPTTGEILIGKLDGDQGKLLVYFQHADNKTDHLDYQAALDEVSLLLNHPGKMANKLGEYPALLSYVMEMNEDQARRFLDEFADASNETIEALAKNPELAGVWRMLDDEGMDQLLKKDAQVLKRLLGMACDL